MTDDSQPDLEVITRPRGGAGKSAEWEWGVYAAGEVVPIVSGRTSGAERKAKAVGEAARGDLLKARGKKSK
jgi:hypothetical protein